ncbi:MAG TPA: tRNA (guanosine(46)-N7)-methyltransferase TrmB [Nevskiaceae bacterium]|nr:tRNA (guanosine(46)-N7)-methyltransferase TrmB [Nevskiaceae bacterium]
MTLAETPHHRRVRSFVRREGRITHAQKDALERLWPRFGIDAPKQLDFAQVFGRVAPIVVEIGFGNGDHLLSRAQNERDKDFLGIEVHRPGVGRVLHRVEQLALTNVRVACHDAVEFLRDAIAPGSLAEVVVYFPDPWPKKRHHKRRLIQPEFVALIANRLASGGVLRLATDWAHYGEQMLAVLSAEPLLRNVAEGGGFGERPATRAPTRFETRGERLGHQVFDLEFQRT